MRSSVVQRTDDTVEVRHVSRVFGKPGASQTQALSNVSLTVPARQFLSIIGPSGCGKSTMFNIIAGLDAPDSGDVLLGDRSILGQQGNVGYLLQKDLLLPWRSILDNVIIGLEISGVPKKEARQIAVPLLKTYGLGGFMHHHPDQLSGGMRQRAALLRTVLFNKDVILLDEPFGKLDAQTRTDMQEWLLDLWDVFQKTVIFVTHDIDEAIYLSDRVIVMSPRPGRIVADITIDMPRPRSPELVTDPEFITIKRRIRHLLDAARISEKASA
ncbi:ABC transporter ATP-binding protein [Pseudoclavibacter sp. CFCC 11306]|uniref:ABC transporter ATP-binding protein n=1 Tax=Pseudoclavibacter sp. CFCC 11306 TaxID=1564493 RepID=UPI0013015ECB|nr:ABC transporter ATP-binding protein [Pseudoclavibacter sp. CFCC 11306]KAB1658870.1 ABC transporter ATP-binding protein [Pseudoclavibacter sp. CFCC 11306]